MEDIVKYLHMGEVIKDRRETHKIRVQAAQYTLINEQLYR